MRFHISCLVDARYVILESVQMSVVMTSKLVLSFHLEFCHL